MKRTRTNSPRLKGFTTQFVQDVVKWVPEDRGLSHLQGDQQQDREAKTQDIEDMNFFDFISCMQNM